MIVDLPFRLFHCLFFVWLLAASFIQTTYQKKCNGNYDKSIQSPHLPWRNNVHDTGYRLKKNNKLLLIIDGDC